MTYKERVEILNLTPYKAVLYTVLWISLFVATILYTILDWTGADSLHRGVSITDGDSMYPTFENGDILYTSDEEYDVGDVVVLLCPEHNYSYVQYYGETMLKRIIAGPGDTISIQQDGVYVNGQRLTESYIAEEAGTWRNDIVFNNLTLGDNEYYVMGDNRAESLDSRKLGVVETDKILYTVTDSPNSFTYSLVKRYAILLTIAFVAIGVVKRIFLRLLTD